MTRTIIKKFSLTVAILIVFLPMTTVFGQTATNCAAITAANNTSCCTGSNASTNTRQCAAYASSGVRQQFTPNVSFGSAFGTGNNLSGMKFSGVSGALLGCANVGKKIVGSVSDLFGQTKIGSDLGARYQNTTSANQNVPVTDALARKELERQTNTEQCLNGLAYAAAKSLLQQVSSKTLNWINTGFNGNPLYTRDLGSYLQTVSDEKMKKFLDYIPGSNPIFGNALRSAITQQVTGISDGRLGTTMNTPEARAYESFLGDFTNGGWDAFLNATQNDNNNPIGAFFQATDQVSGNIASEQQRIKDELQRNQGFLDMRKCVQYADSATTNSTNNSDSSQFPYRVAYKTTTNSASIVSCKTDYEEIVRQGDSACPKDEKYSACYDQVLQRQTSAVTAALNNGNCVRSQGNSNSTVQTEPQCLRYETVTPGSLIAQQAAYITNSPVRQLEYADKINEVLGSFFDNLLNRFLQNGLGGLRTSGAMNFSGSGGGFGENVVLGTDGQALASSSEMNAFGYSVTGSGYRSNDFDISRPQMIGAATQAQYDFLIYSQDSRAIMNKIVPTVGALDYCLPGPNPTWQQGLESNFQQFISSLEVPTKEKTGVGKALSFLATGGGLLGSPKTDTELSNSLAGQAALFDKVTDSTLAISPAFYQSTSKDSKPDDVYSFLQNSIGQLVKEYQTTFDRKKIIATFAGIDPDPNYATAMIDDSYDEAGSIISYNQNAIALEQQYLQSIDDTEDAIRELESIRKEVNSIVAGAKTRYIRDRAAANDPVDLSCINNAYYIPTITPLNRQQPDFADPMIDQSIRASEYFYTNL